MHKEENINSSDDDSFVGPPRPQTPPSEESRKRVRATNSNSGDSGDDDDDFVGPPKPTTITSDGEDESEKQKKKKLKPNGDDDENEISLREIRLSLVPNAQMYERSYMHRTTVTHTLCTPHTNFIVTASTDGIIKWWKKLDVGDIEFVKTVRAHTSRVVDMVCSVDGQMLVTVARLPTRASYSAIASDSGQTSSSSSSSIKVFDVVNFDMVNVVNVEYPVARIAILDNVGHGLKDLFGNTTSIKYRNKKLIAVVECGTKIVRVYDPLQGFDDGDDENGENAAETEGGNVRGGSDVQYLSKFRLQRDSDFEVLETDATAAADGKVEDSATSIMPVVKRYSRPLAVIENLPHRTPIHLIAYNHHYDTIVTVDYDNVIDYWQFMDEDDQETRFRPPPHPGAIDFRFKTQTDLYEFAKHGAFVLSLEFNSGRDSSMFVTYSLDRKVRLFDFCSGKLLHTWDESLELYQQLQKRGDLGLENIDFGRRVAIEKEIMDSQAQLARVQNASKIPGNTVEKREQNNTINMNVIFDASGMFIMYATMIGIKVANVQSKKLEILLGKVENTERYLHVALFQGKLKPSVSRQIKQRQQQQQQRQLQQDRVGGHVRLFQDPDESTAESTGYGDTVALPSHQQTRDPSVFATSYKKQRFYIFTRREPADDILSGSDDQMQHRDVFNEKPSKEDVEVHQEMMKHALPKEAIIHTSFGDIHVHLFGDVCPKAVENFCGLAEKGYYNGLLFHRVIKKFMIQTGDPNGDGTGGTSFWGNNFGDEFHPSLRFDTGFKLAMANAGPNTNGSQFFITTTATPWLNNKHTLFGEVIKGKDIVQAIEAVKTDKQDKPLHDVKLLSIEVRQR